MQKLDAFSYMGLLVALMLLGILASIALPRLQRASLSACARELSASLFHVKNNLALYYLDRGQRGLPATRGEVLAIIDDLNATQANAYCYLSFIHSGGKRQKARLYIHMQGGGSLIDSQLKLYPKNLKGIETEMPKLLCPKKEAFCRFFNHSSTKN